MSKKENFGQAMYEMFGVGKEPVAPEKAAPQPAAPIASTPIEEPIHTAPVTPKTFVEPSSSKPRYEATYFAPGTSLEGTLRAKGDVEIAGDFKGEIISEGCVTIHAHTTSNVTADTLCMVDCTLTGDATVVHGVDINENSSVIGNLNAGEICCSGKIKGDMTVNGLLTLTRTADVNGNIKAVSIAMERGARISGVVEMNNAE